MPRGRTRRPPRKDPDEIKQNSARWDEKVHARLEANLPDAPPPPPDESAPEADLLVLALRRALARVGTDEEVGKLLQAPFGWLTAAGLAALAEEENLKSLFTAPSEEELASAAEKARAAPPPGPPTDSELKFDRELVAQLRGAGAPMPPAWVLDAACDALAAQMALGLAGCGTDEDGAEALRLINTIREKIHDPGGRGVKGRLLLFYEAEAKFKAFVATIPTPADYRDTFLGFYVPIFNATNGECRRCVECGAKFALRTPAEVEASRHCSDECGARSRNRGRDKVHGGRAEAEAKGTRAGGRLTRHMRACPNCTAGRNCDTRERLLIADMSSPPLRFESQKPLRK